jgi:hypothetical protein
MRSVEVELIHSAIRTDMTKLIVAFRSGTTKFVVSGLQTSLLKTVTWV